MSVARCREINARLRAAGITVHEWPGWESRGNGQTSAYEGCIVHHTASPYGMTYQALVTGRADLAGPLCNYGGNEDGSLTVVAAHPANHAGASGGRSMGPLPITTLFNKRVMGLEIVYPGISPMRPAQYRAAAVWTRITTDVLGYGDIQRGRAHAETSITGKWDPGYVLGKTIDMAQFRAAAQKGVAAMADLDNMERILRDLERVLGSYYASYKAVYGEAAANAHLLGRGMFDVELVLGHAYTRTGKSIGNLVADMDVTQAAHGKALAQLISMHGGGGDLDSAEAWERVVAASAEAAERGAEQGAREAVEAHVVPALRPLLLEVLGEDNEAQVDELLVKAGERLMRAAGAAAEPAPEA